MGAIELANLRRRAREAGIAPGILARTERARYHASQQTGLHAPPEPRLVDAAPIQFEGVHRWVVAICKTSMSRSVGEDLNAIGFRAYCPLGRRIVYRGRTGSSQRKRRIHQFAVFGRYLFVGELQEPLNSYHHEGIVDVIGDSLGAWPLKPRVLQAINEAELAGKWNDRDPDATFKRGDHVRLSAGPFASFEGFVLECSKAGVKIDVEMFGRKISTTVKSSVLELV